MAAVANVRNNRTGELTIVQKDTPEEAVQQLSNILRINGWDGSPDDVRPGKQISHRGFTYWVE